MESKILGPVPSTYYAFHKFVLLLLLPKWCCLFPVNLGKRGTWTKHPWRLSGPEEVEVPEMKKDDFGFSGEQGGSIPRTEKALSQT